MQLRMAIDKAKQSNMPKDNIDRLLAKFEAKKNSLVSCSFEGFGPWGVPLIVEVETDNKNRIISEIKNIFKKNNGNIGENGSVAYLFDRVGEIEVANLSEESKLSLIDVPGVIDFEQEMVITTASKIKEVLGEIKQRGWEVVRDGLVLRARLPVKLNTENEVEQVMNLIDELESQDDVVAVYSGFDYQP